MNPSENPIRILLIEDNEEQRTRGIKWLNKKWEEGNRQEQNLEIVVVGGDESELTDIRIAPGVSIKAIGPLPPDPDLRAQFFIETALYELELGNVHGVFTDWNIGDKGKDTEADMMPSQQYFTDRVILKAFRDGIPFIIMSGSISIEAFFQKQEWEDEYVDKVFLDKARWDPSIYQTIIDRATEYKKVIDEKVLGEDKISEA